MIGIIKKEFTENQSPPLILETKGNKTAFTLAELLIVLGIIGIVAALTMPSLTASYQKQEITTRLQKTISVLNQAIKRAEVDHGEYIHWEDGFDIGAQPYFEKYWKPYFNIVKDCKTYSDCGYSQHAPFVDANGAVVAFGVADVNRRGTFILADGTIIIISTTSSDTSGNLIPYDIIFVDVNGPKKPNKLGRDVFQLVKGYPFGVLPLGYNLTDAEVNNNCKRGGNGSYCASKLMREGWKVSDDYPW